MNAGSGGGPNSLTSGKMDNISSRVAGGIDFKASGPG